MVASEDEVGRAITGITHLPESLQRIEGVILWHDSGRFIWSYGHAFKSV